MGAVVAVAYGSAAPQLGIAEFAPAARNQPEPPPTTAIEEGRSAGASRRRSPTTTAPPASATTAPVASAAATAPTTLVGRGRPCYGNPPRQAEDPMSPTCLATIFEGDNGGSTSAGVSSTEIRVAVPLLAPNDAEKTIVSALFEYVNQRFELYGRRLVPVFFGGDATLPTSARALVADIASQGVFAAMTAYQELLPAHAALPVELARQHVVTIVQAAGVAWSDRTLFDAWHPYVWSVYPSADDVQANLADLACAALEGRPARHAGDTSLQAKTRRFGVIAASADTPPAATVLTRALTDCTGVAPLRVDVAGSGNLRVALERLQADGVTTMFCVCEDQLAQQGLSTAHSIRFYPEWLLTPVTLFGCPRECWVQSMRTTSRSIVPILLDAGPRLMPLQGKLWFGALQGVLATPGMSAATALGFGEYLHHGILMLASGIQGAGPTLTPDTFAQALMSTEFPNPGAGQAPFWQPSAGFGPGDHSFYDDYSLAWWSDTAEAFELAQGARPQGSWCYVGRAARFRVGAYPADTDSLLFNPDVPCR